MFTIWWYMPFSVVLDVHAISLVNVHGTSRCLMSLFGRRCCPPVREGLQNSEVASNCSASVRARVSLPAGPTHEIYVIQERYTALSLYMVVAPLCGTVNVSKDPVYPASEFALGFIRASG